MMMQDVPCFHYHGVDVVRSVIAKNQEYAEQAMKNYTSTSSASAYKFNISFSIADLSQYNETITIDKQQQQPTEDKQQLVATTLPRDYDLILSRDALQHLPTTLVKGVIINYCHSQAQYLLVGSYLEEDSNHNLDDIEIGGCRQINLLWPPFSFPSPVEAFRELKQGDEMKESPKYLLFYHLPDLCDKLKKQTFWSGI